MKISVALASYNGAAYIARQLQSLADQTRRLDELVVADDCSGDETLDVVREVLGRNGMTAIILENSSGTQLRPPKNFERAISRCSGDLVFCCDQDDEWDASKVERVHELMESRTELACILNNARFCDEDLQATGLSKMETMRRNGLPEEAFVMGCCAAFRKSYLDFALPIPDEITHDGWLVGLCDLLKISERISEVLQSYRLHDANVSVGFYINTNRRSLRITQNISRLIGRLKGLGSNQALLRELLFVSAAEERLLSQRSRILDAYPQATYDEALFDVSSRRRILEFRRSIRQAKFSIRLRLLWIGFQSGKYRGLGGAPNAIKDALSHIGSAEKFKLWPR